MALRNEVTPRADLICRSDVVHIAAGLNAIEDSRPEAQVAKAGLLRELERHTPEGHFVVGVTGPPGVGKSTLVHALVSLLVKRLEVGVGVLAIDPSSRGGGALLGDRLRLRFPPGDPIFVRSMATGGRPGGLAPAARAALVVFRAAYPWTIVETVGAGQAETDVVDAADMTVLVLQPNLGDRTQFMKSGIMELADVIVVNKSDLARAEQTRAEIATTVHAAPNGWRRPVVGTSSLTRRNVDKLEAVVRECCSHLQSTSQLKARREAAVVEWTLELMRERYGSHLIDRLGGLERTRERVRAGFGTALDRLTQSLGNERPGST